jgi:hypothetical protein
MAAEYHFVTSWKIQGTSRVVAEGANHRWAMASGEGASSWSCSAGERGPRRSGSRFPRLPGPRSPGRISSESAVNPRGRESLT